MHVMNQSTLPLSICRIRILNFTQKNGVLWNPKMHEYIEVDAPFLQDSYLSIYLSSWPSKLISMH
jgi:hypothetical protein